MVTPFLQDPDVTLWHGDVLDVLAELPAESADCVVTSPPYWGLRSYLDDGHEDKPLEFGLEPTPDQYVARMVEVFREVRRVLCPHGTCWVNLGDSYASADTYKGAGGSGGKQATHPGSFHDGRVGVPAGLKPKDLVGIPWRVAFALQQDGWWLRSAITWCKPNAMPESVTDRPTKATEMVFLLTKAARYYYDAEAIRRPHQHDGRKITQVVGQENSLQHRNGERWPGTGSNERDWWLIATQPYANAHFATYPEELVRRCVLAGCAERVCRVCGKPSERIVEQQVDGERHVSPKDANPNRNDGDPASASWSSSRLHSQYFDYQRTEVGWSDCGHDDVTPVEGTPEAARSAGMASGAGGSLNWRPGMVLDPFVGSGTTCLVARNHGRHSVGIDLNETYLELAARRLQQLSLLTAEATQDG